MCAVYDYIKWVWPHGLSPPPTVVLLSEDKKMSVGLKKRGITAETVHRAEQDPTFPIKILPAHYLPRLYQELGEFLLSNS